MPLPKPNMLDFATNSFVTTPIIGAVGDKYYDDLRIIQTLLGVTDAEIPINTDRPIAAIDVRHGGIVDSIEVTYNLNNGQKYSITHGGDYGHSDGRITLGENEVLVNVCGKIGPNPIFDGHTYLNQVSFIILDTGKGNVRVAGPFGNGCGSNTGDAFSVATPFAFRMYAYTKQGKQTGISGIGIVRTQT